MTILTVGNLGLPKSEIPKIPEMPKRGNLLVFVVINSIFGLFCLFCYGHCHCPWPLFVQERKAGIQ